MMNRRIRHIALWALSVLLLALPSGIQAEEAPGILAAEPVLKTDLPEGACNLSSRYSSLYLNLAGALYTNGASLIQYPYEDRTNSVFLVTRNDDDSYSFQFLHSKKMLDEDVVNRRALQWTAHGKDNQRWYVYEGPEGQLYLKNKDTGHWLRFNSLNSTAAPELTDTLDPADSSYAFLFEEVSDLPSMPQVVAEIQDGYYNLKNSRTGGYVNLAGALYGNGGLVIQYGYEDRSNSVLKITRNQDAGYTLQFLHSKLMMDEDVPGGRVLQWKAHGGDNQTWYLFEGTGGQVFLRNKMTGHWIRFDAATFPSAPILDDGMDLDDSRYAFDLEKVGTLPEEPYVAAIVNGLYFIRSKASGLFLDFPDSSLRGGANLIQWGFTGSESQKFIVSNQTTGSVIETVNSEMVLDIYGESRDDGAAVIQWAYHGGDNQLWDTKANEDGSFTLVSRHSGKVIDVAGASGAPGARVIQWLGHDGDNQRWYFENAPASVPAPSTIYLTFDDGPSYLTADILDILKEEGIKATFFIEGIYGADYGYLMQRIVDEGHTIAIHCYTHDYSVVYSSPTAYFNDLYSAKNIVASLTGVDSRILRFPGGSSNTVSRNYSPGIMSYLTQEVQNRGFHYFDWNVSSGDTAQIGASGVYNSVVSGLDGKPVLVVLMHDRSGNEQTRDALRGIIQYGKNNGYAFDRIRMSTPQIHHSVAN